MTNTEIVVPDVPDCSPLGAAMMGMLGCDVYASLEAMSGLTHDSRLFHPTMAPATVKVHHDGWQKAVRQVLAGVSEHHSPEKDQ